MKTTNFGVCFSLEPNVLLHASTSNLEWIMYLADLQWMTKATGNYDNDRTSQKKIHLKWGYNWMQRTCPSHMTCRKNNNNRHLLPRVCGQKLPETHCKLSLSFISVLWNNCLYVVLKEAWGWTYLLHIVHCLTNKGSLPRETQWDHNQYTATRCVHLQIHTLTHHTGGGWCTITWST